MASKNFPLIDPRPPRLSEQGEALRRIEASGQFSNNGPEVRRFEAAITDRLFGGAGASLAVANATAGLMIAIRNAAGTRPAPAALALMPGLTFAATAQAALWAGLTPLICDIDADDWSACPVDEERLLKTHGGRIAVIVPYATFGNAIDLDRYSWLQQRYGVGVVVDAAASLGTIDPRGQGFGAGAPFAVVYSMHATKTFAVAEAGMIHSGDIALVDRLRAMANFGFEAGRSATLPGLNAKLPEVIALMAQLKLDEIDTVCAGRAATEQAYRDALAGFQLQRVRGVRRASQFMPVLLPSGQASHRSAIAAALADRGIGCGQYFSPHLAEQPWFKANALIEPTPVADEVAARMISLPITDAMTPADAQAIAAAFRVTCEAAAPAKLAASAKAVSRAMRAGTVLIGGGPAGTALLTAASKRGRLADLAASGLVIVERDAAIGGGRLGGYGITSDSTATTFLSSVKDNPHPEIAALIDHPAARAVRRYADSEGVPLTDVGPLIRATGARLGAIVSAQGGTILTGHEALGAAQGANGRWRVDLRNGADGAPVTVHADSIVIATGGHQPIDRLAMQQVAGIPIARRHGDKLLQSDGVLAVGGLDRVRDLIGGKRDPRIVVIGGSTSALATIALLLKAQPALPIGAGGIALLHRRPLRPFYPSIAAAQAEGFSDFGPDDICPVSGFVYRLAGFRLEARELVLRMLSVDGRTPEPRVMRHQIAGEHDDTARALIERADLVIAALGYRPYALPLSDRRGRRIALAADHGAAMVDRHCRVVAADGQPIPGAYGIGLAAGFVPWGPQGGEPSFRGQANGLWQWQNDVGAMIVDQVLGAEARAVA